MSVSRLALGNHTAIGHVQGGEQGRRTMTNVVVRDAFYVSQAHRQHRLRALQSLNLALLIDTQYQRVIRRIQIKPDYIAHFLDENGSVESLKDLERCGCSRTMSDSGVR